MSLDRGGVQGQRDGVFTRLRQGLKDRPPSAFLGPAVKPIVDRRVGAVLTRAIAPSTSRLQHMDDTADDPSVVVSPWTGQARRQMGLDAHPLLVAQPKQTRMQLSCLQVPVRAENHIVTIRYRP